jgi:hypothetical protein
MSAKQEDQIADRCAFYASGAVVRGGALRIEPGADVAASRASARMLHLQRRHSTNVFGVYYVQGYGARSSTALYAHMATCAQGSSAFE